MRRFFLRDGGPMLKYRRYFTYSRRMTPYSDEIKNGGSLLGRRVEREVQLVRLFGQAVYSERVLKLPE